MANKALKRLNKLLNARNRLARDALETMKRDGSNNYLRKSVRARVRDDAMTAVLSVLMPPDRQDGRRP